MSKQQVSIFMGGTGANTASDARTNLGVVARSGDTMTGNLNVAATLITQNVIPNANITYDLGSSEARFKDLWLSNSTIYLGEASISAQGGNVSFGNAEIQLSNVTTKLNVTNDLFVSGNVGIGTENPGSKLTIGTSFASTVGITVDGASASDSQLVLRKSASNTAFGILAWDSQVYLSAGIYYDGGTWVQSNNDNNNLLFTLDPGGGARWYASNDGSSSWNVSSDIQLWNDSSNWTSLVQSTRSGDSYFTGGNVGIGVSSPLFTKFTVAKSDTGTSIGTNYNPGIFNLQNSSATNGNLSLIGFQDASAFVSLAAIGAINVTHSGSPNSVVGALAFYTKASGSGYVSERMRIDQSGNVGIGTTSPASLLHLYGASNPFIRVQAGGGSYSYLRLDDGSSNGYLIKNITGGTGNGALPGALYTYTDNNCAFQHLHAGTTLFTILSSGIVTMPAQTMFAAKHNATEAPGAGVTFINWTVTTNQGGGSWNPSEGYYTVPVAGRYLVTCSLLRNTGGGAGGVYLQRNSSTIIRLFYCDNGGGTELYEMGSGQYIVDCAANDYLSVVNENGGVSWYGDSTGLGNFTVNLLG